MEMIIKINMKRNLVLQWKTNLEENLLLTLKRFPDA